MPTASPAAETAAYLATLTPAQHARAVAYTHGGEWILLWTWLAGLLACVLILRSGVLVRLRHALDPGRTRPNLAVAAGAAGFLLLDWLLTLPWTVYAGWWRERSYGLSSQPFQDWFGQSAIGTAIDVVLSVPTLLAVYALMRRTRLWWAWSGAVGAVFIVLSLVISPVLIEPVFNRYTPAPPGAVRDTVSRLAAEVGVPDARILVFDGSRQSNRYTANVSGLFGSARVAMSDVMFRKNADMAEIRGIVGHELGHYVLHHTLWLALGFSLLCVLTGWLADRLYAPVRDLLAAPGVTGLADPAGLPVLAVIVTTLLLLATPLTNGMIRTVESQADRFSLQHANEPDGLSRGLAKTIEYRASSPSWLEETLFYDHPSVQRRIRRAMEWKAAHPPAP